MKSPIPLLLYVTSAGLFGLAGWTVYEMLPMWKESVRSAATQKGQDEGAALVSSAKGSSSVAPLWKYGDRTGERTVSDWWKTFREANLIGKLPPPPKDDGGDVPPPPPPPPPVKPLEQIFDLVVIVHDTEAGKGKGGQSHVILRYKPEANVQPPEWYVRENMAAPVGGSPPPLRGDTVPANRANGRQNPPPAAGAKPGRGPAPTSPMPTASVVGREILQVAWVEDGGDPRRSSALWEPYSDIRLVGVAPDAQSAWFVRKPPPPKPGEAATEPVKEEVLKTTLEMNQALAIELRKMRGETGDLRNKPAAPVANNNKWVEVEETTTTGKTVNIGRKDEKRFRENSEEFLSQLNMDSYISKHSSVRGVQVRSVDRQLASKFGIQETDVLMEINGRPVQTKAQAIQAGKADYERGVRTFNTKWLSNGQVVERVYQAPDR